MSKIGVLFALALLGCASASPAAEPASPSPPSAKPEVPKEKRMEDITALERLLDPARTEHSAERATLTCELAPKMTPLVDTIKADAILTYEPKSFELQTAITDLRKVCDTHAAPRSEEQTEDLNRRMDYVIDASGYIFRTAS